MPGMKLEIKKDRLAQYYKAEEKILKGQSYRIGTRQVTRADLAVVQNEIKELETEIEALEKHGTTGRRAVRVVPFG